MGKAKGAEKEAEDHIAEFEKRIETLVSIANDAEFESGSLVGDIRDTMLDIFKNRPKPWSAMSESEQRDVAKALENVAKTFIRKTVVVVAEEDLFSVMGQLKGYSGKGGTFKLNVEARGDEETARELFNMDGHDVVIMSADAQRFLGQKQDAEIQPDAPQLGLEPPGDAAEEVDLEEAAEEVANEATTGEEAPAEEEATAVEA